MTGVARRVARPHGRIRSAAARWGAIERSSVLATIPAADRAGFSTHMGSR